MFGLVLCQLVVNFLFLWGIFPLFLPKIGCELTNLKQVSLASLCANFQSHSP